MKYPLCRLNNLSFNEFFDRLGIEQLTVFVLFWIGILQFKIVNIVHV